MFLFDIWYFYTSQLLKLKEYRIKFEYGFAHLGSPKQLKWDWMSSLSTPCLHIRTEYQDNIRKKRDKDAVLCQTVPCINLSVVSMYICVCMHALPNWQTQIQTTVKRGLNSFKLPCTYSDEPAHMGNYCRSAVSKTLAFSWVDLLLFVSQLNISSTRERKSVVQIQLLNPDMSQFIIWAAMDICWNHFMGEKHSFTLASLPVSLMAKVLARDWEFK